VVKTYKGVPVVTSTNKPSSDADAPTASSHDPESIVSHMAIAFLDNSTAAMGEIDAVHAAIDRRKSGAGIAAQLAPKAQQVSAKNDFWFTSVVPLAQFANAMPDPNIAGAMQGNLLGAIQQASGGVRFGPTVVLNGEALTRSPQDASALVDVVKFIAGLIQTNRQNDRTSAQVSTLLDSLQASAQGNVMTMSLSIPEAVLEQMIHTVRQQHAAPKNDPAR